MLRRLVCAGVGVALLGAFAVAAGQGCYNAPEPDCGFVCGSGGVCPDDYHCVPSENRCHRNGTPETLSCGPILIDAFREPPHDAPRDAPPDAPADAPPDAM